MPSELIPYFWGGLGAGLLLVWASMYCNRRRRLMENIPTSKTTGVFIGFVELKGEVECETPIQSYLAECTCVHYKYSIEERWSKTETYTDSEGKTKTRTKSGWKTVASDTRHTPFYLQDDEGVIRVLPEGAKAEGTRVFSQTVRRGAPLYYGKGPQRSVMHSDHRRRFVEHAVSLHEAIYLMGQSRVREDIVAPEIAKDKSAPMFLISTRSEEQITKSLKIWAWVWAILGMAIAIGATIFGASEAGVSAGGYAAMAGGIQLLVWILGWCWMVYNSFGDLRQRVNQGWSNVDVQLKRRHDLIPNLVAAVEGIKSHEQDVQTTVALLRSQQTVTKPGQTGEDPHGCAGKIIALAESYPELTANDSFLRLQKALVDTEQRIALARTYYNEIVAHYNTRLLLVPEKFVTKLLGFGKEEFIQAEGFERAVVNVHFTEAAAQPAAALHEDAAALDADEPAGDTAE